MEILASPPGTKDYLVVKMRQLHTNDCSTLKMVLTLLGTERMGALPSVKVAAPINAGGNRRPPL